MMLVMDLDLEKRVWWSSLEGGIRELLLESVLLQKIAADSSHRFHDYSFIVFPAAKAYEGFLKRIFLDLGFISKEEYLGKRFRIGKALNPSLEANLRHESVYDKIVNYCRGEDLARRMWDTWKYCRNLVFHYFPNETNVVDYEGAVQRVGDIVKTIEETYKGCKIKLPEK